MLERLDAANRNPARAATVLALLALALLLAPGGALQPERAGAQESGAQDVPPPPKVEAKAWALIDKETGRYLAGNNPDERLQMGSTAKIMSALVALEDGGNLDREVTVSENAASYAKPPYSNVGLFPFDRVSVRELIEAVLIPSGIDAVYALAEDVGDGSSDRFVEKMNQEVESLGLQNTHFENPAGLDDKEQYSSARDLALMARAGLEFPVFAETVDTEETTITADSRKIDLLNTNDLLDFYESADGVKTGTTPQAGENLVASASKDGESYIVALMDAKDRFVASEVVLEYAFERYERRSLVRQGKVYAEAGLPYRQDQSVRLVAREEVVGLVDGSSEVERRVSTGEIPVRAEAGQRLGRVEVLVDGKRVGRTPLIAREGYAEATLWQKTRFTVGGWLRSAGRYLDRLVT